MFTLISLENSVAQKKTLISVDYKFRLQYKNNHLIAFSCIDLTESFYKRYKEKEKCKLSWINGEVSLESSNSDCNGSIRYTFRFDTLSRIYEASLYSTWSNHIYSEYLARKYDGLDTLPFLCYHHSHLNYPEREKISWQCDNEFKWLDIIERELKLRGEFYDKSYDDIVYRDWIVDERNDDYFKFWSTEK